jgi:hypothetical protein
MRQRGAFDTGGWEDLVAKFLNKSILNEFAPDWTVHTARPRTAPIHFTAAQIHEARVNAATTLAHQAVANGTATDFAAERDRLLAQWGETSPDPSQRHTPKARKDIKKPLKKQRRPKTAKPKTDRPKTADEWLQQAARILTQRRIRNGEQLDPAAAYTESLAELRRDYFNPDHWKKCDILQTDYLKSIPTNVNDPKIRAYAYTDPANKRSLAQYHEGELDDAPPRYAGVTTGGQFRDNLLVWSRTTYKLVNEIEPGEIEPTFIEIQGRIRAYADRRGSRPMLSYICKTWLTATGSSYLTTTTPPTAKPWSFYYRYKVPDTAPPYYASEDIKHVVRTMRQKRHEEPDVRLTHAVVLLAPRPMYGRGFNNNVSVTTQMFADAKLWQISLSGDGSSWRHVYMLVTGYPMSGHREFRGSGLDIEERWVVDEGTFDPVQFQLNINAIVRLVPQEREDFYNAALPHITGRHGCIIAHHNQQVFPAKSYTTDWYLVGTSGLQDDLERNNIDLWNEHAFLGVIWDSRANVAIPIPITDFYSDGIDGMGNNHATFDTFKGPHTTLWIRDDIYWTSNP